MRFTGMVRIFRLTSFHSSGPPRRGKPVGRVELRNLLREWKT